MRPRGARGDMLNTLEKRSLTTSRSQSMVNPHWGTTDRPPKSSAGKPHGRYWLLHPDSWHDAVPVMAGRGKQAVNAIGFHGTSSEMTWPDPLKGVISRSISSPAVFAPLDSKTEPQPAELPTSFHLGLRRSGPLSVSTSVSSAPRPARTRSPMGRLLSCRPQLDHGLTEEAGWYRPTVAVHHVPRWRL